MRKKMVLFITIISLCLCLTACVESKHDTITIYNRSYLKFDDILIEAKDGYFYDKHEKFTVDDNTIAVTIYFLNSKKDDEDDWDDK